MGIELTHREINETQDYLNQVLRTEAAHQNTQFMKGKTEGAITKVTHEQRLASNGDKPDPHKKKKCYRCGKQRHAATDCLVKDSNATSVGAKATFAAKVCRTKIIINLTECIETNLPPSAHMDNVIFRVEN